MLPNLKKSLLLPAVVALPLLPSVACASVASGIEAAEVPHQQERGQWMLGAGVVNVDWGYKDMNDDAVAIPLVQYQGDKLFIRGTRMGYELARGNGMYLSVIGEMGVHSFDHDNSDQLEDLDDRHHSYNAGFHAGWRTPDGHHFRLAALTDVSKTHDGSYVNLSYGQQYGSLKNDWMVVPEVGLKWVNSNYADYYFSVSDQEAARSGLEAYHAGSEINPYVKLTATYHLDERYTLVGHLNYTRLGDEIYDSSMVNDRNTLTSFAGVVYHF